MQEAKSKWPDLMATYPDIALHLIGPLQSNKAKEAVALFDAIHSVDRASLCEALAKEIVKQDRHPQLFVQLNTGEEPQKAGIAPADADAFIASCRDVYGLRISGLMCIPPVDDPPAPHFALTAKIAARNGLSLLSMGMSADFETAIQLGATHVRVGSSILENGSYPITIFVRGPIRSSKQHRAAGQPDTACGGSEFFARQMDKHGAAAFRDTRLRIVVDLDNEIVQVILAHQPVAGLARLTCDCTIIVTVGGIFGPGVGRRDRADGQMCLWQGIPVGTPPQPDRAEYAARGGAVAFELVGLDSAASKRDR